MLPDLRAAFNAKWSESAYRDLVQRLELRTGATLNFPISETPCFFPRSLMDTLAATGTQLIEQILNSPDAMRTADAAVPERYRGHGAEAS